MRLAAMVNPQRVVLERNGITPGASFLLLAERCCRQCLLMAADRGAIPGITPIAEATGQPHTFID